MWALWAVDAQTAQPINQEAPTGVPVFTLDAFILLGVAHSFHGELRRELRVSGSTARAKICTDVGINKLDDPLGL